MKNSLHALKIIKLFIVSCIGLSVLNVQASNIGSNYLIVGNSPAWELDQIKDLSHNRIIVALDGAADKLDILDVKPNVIIGDMDSIDQQKWGIDSSRSEDYENSEGVLIACRNGQKLTDLSKAIVFCEKRNASNILIMNVVGGRIDQTLRNIGYLRQYHDRGANISVRTKYQTLKFGKDNTFPIEGKEGEYCGIMAYPAANITTNGLVYECNNMNLDFARKESTSNILRHKNATVTIKGEALVISPNIDPVSRKEERKFVAFIRSLAEPLGIKVDTYLRDWNIILRKDNVHKLIFYYCFPLNSSSTSRTCTDKCATSDLLGKFDIPHVEHKIFLHPKLGQYLDNRGVHFEIKEYAQRHNYNVVCKKNTGSSGRDMFVVSNPRELEEAVHELFRIDTELAISPFYEVEYEYRVIILDENIELIYRKERPSIVGNGKLSVRNLYLDYIQNTENPVLDPKFLKSDKVLEEGEKINLTWQHNLSQSAKPTIIDREDNVTLWRNLEQIAMRSAQALNLRFGTIDVFETRDSQKPFIVIEANSGVTLKKFMRFGERNKEIARTIYRNAIKSMFEIAE